MMLFNSFDIVRMPLTYKSKLTNIRRQLQILKQCQNDHVCLHNAHTYDMNVQHLTKNHFLFILIA